MINWEKIANQFFKQEFEDYKKKTAVGRRPDSVEFTTIDQDVSRRDLTINALFYDIEKKQIVDLIGGIEDLKNGVIKTVGNAEERFNEDPLRKLRAIRFAGRFGSNLDKNSAEALSKDNNLHGVSFERIRDEFLKGIKSSKNTVNFLNLIDSYKMFNWVFPNLNINKLFINSKEIPVVLAEILKGNKIERLKMDLNKLAYSRDEIAQISFLLSLLTINIDNVISLKRAQKNSKLTDAQIREFSEINNLDKKLIDTFLKFNLSVNGNDVTNDGFTGTALGQEINRRETENFKKFIS